MHASISGRPRWLLQVGRVCLLAAVLGASAVSCSLEPLESVPDGPVSDDVIVEIAARYGLDCNSSDHLDCAGYRWLDRNANGIVDMPNSSAYVQDSLQVRLDAGRLAGSLPGVSPTESGDSAGSDNLDGPWRWVLKPAPNGTPVRQEIAALPTPTSPIDGLSASNDGAIITAFSNTPVLDIELYEGDWSVELARVDDAGSRSDGREITITVDDYLIVQIGDSFSAGEGAPEQDADGRLWGWGDDGTGPNQDHQDSHRSSKTWGSLFAVDVENLTDRSSVTYLNLAVTGHEIDNIAGQVDQLQSLVGQRPIDVLLVSAGGNDAGFTNSMAAYILREPVALGLELGASLGAIKQAIETGDWLIGDVTGFSAGMFAILLELDRLAPTNVAEWPVAKLGLNHLENGRDGVGGYSGEGGLADQLDRLGVDPANVYILQYPDPFVPDPSQPDEVCQDSILSLQGIPIPGREFGVSPEEQARARSDFLTPLNATIARAASDHGWHVMPGESAFYGHAFCSGERRINAVLDSLSTQGDHMGVAHPTSSGYESLAQIALDVWLEHLAQPDQLRP
jgi:lysophospholipase L1-like esterase